jgi:hypothetical protein
LNGTKDQRRTDNKARLQVSRFHLVAFFPRQESHCLTQLHQGNLILVGSSPYQLQIIVYKRLGILSTQIKTIPSTMIDTFIVTAIPAGTKIDEMNCSAGMIIQEIGKIGVTLGKSPFKNFLE